MKAISQYTCFQRPKFADLTACIASVAAIIVTIGCASTGGKREGPVTATPLTNGFSLEVAQWGPDEATIVRASNALLNRKAVRDIIGDGKARLLHFKVVEDESQKSERPPNRYEALIYDYTHEQTLIARGDFSRLEDVDVSTFSFQPPPTLEEYREAVEIVRADPQFQNQLRSGSLTPYRAMPGIAEEQLEDGSRRRIVTIGLLPAHPERAEALPPHQVIGVSLGERRVFRDGAGGIRIYDTGVCEIPADAGQPTVSQASGQVRVRILQNGQTIWTLVAVRPAASSGTRGSGVELRHVYFKGVEVLYRGHVPILNIHYDKDACGPYRDWQNEEGRFEANGTDVAPGFRLCSTPARTIAESGSDNGNFNGVAIYVDGQDVVFVSEMEAGWYRYISKWRLNTSGTIRPEFGFAATQNSCTCKLHFHNCYWRFDFDINGASGDRIDEFNNPPIIANNNWHAKSFEMQRPRDAAHQRKWKVSDGARSYTLTPGANDGTADTFARGDLWFLRYHGGELDDGHNSVSSNCEADITKFDNDEALVGKDVVVWYSAHFTHDATHVHGATFQGPTLTPGGW
jgi:hypothetical protein